MLFSPHSTSTILVCDHCYFTFRPHSNSFLTGLQNQYPIYLDRLIFLKHCFYHATLLFHYFPWLPLLPSLKSAWPSVVPQTHSDVSLPRLRHAFPIQSLSTVSGPGVLLLPIILFNARCPSFSFKSCPSSAVHFLHEAHLTTLTLESPCHLMSGPCTLPLNYILFCSLIAPCTVYISCLSIILDLHEWRACLLPLCSLQKSGVI